MNNISKQYYNSLKSFIFPSYKLIIEDDLNEYFNNEKDIKSLFLIKFKYSSNYFSKHINSINLNSLYYYGYIKLPYWTKLDDSYRIKPISNTYFNTLLTQYIKKLKFEIHTDIELSKSSILIDQNYIYENSNIENKYLIESNPKIYWSIDKIIELKKYIESILDFMNFFKESTIPKLSKQWNEDIETYLSTLI